MTRINLSRGPLALAVSIILGAAVGACASPASPESNGTAGDFPYLESETGGTVHFSRCAANKAKDEECISLRYVAYRDGKSDAVLSANQAEDNIQAINKVWDQCRIQFEIEEFFVVDPKKRNLEFNTSSDDELPDIRTAFQAPKSLLVVNTGDWSGDLGEGSANAWTMMPGSAPYGAVLEASVATYPNIVAHELGHYLGLDHADDESRLMNPVIYNDSTELTTGECAAARKSAKGIWAKMLR